MLYNKSNTSGQGLVEYAIILVLVALFVAFIIAPMLAQASDIITELLPF